MRHTSFAKSTWFFLLALAIGIIISLTTCRKSKTVSHAIFTKPATEFNRELALLSFDGARETASKEDAEIFATERMHFDTVQASPDYESDPTPDSIGYVFSHGAVGDYELIAVMIRGFDYGAEWAGNFHMGKTDDHEGFSRAAEKVYAGLKDYISAHFADKPLKLWISGYSRAGAVANVLSQRILSRDDIDVTQENMFVYTIEAPQGLTEAHAEAYPNVFNIINSADIVPAIAPNAYGLRRCGIDKDIYRSDIDELMQKAEHPIPAFVPVSEDDAIWFFKADTEQEFVSGLLERLMEHPLVVYPGFGDRESYAETVEDSLCYIIELATSLSSDDRQELIGAFKEFLNNLFSTKEDDFIAALNSAVMQNNAFYIKVMEILSRNDIPYESGRLQRAFWTTIQLVLSKIDLISGCTIYADNLKRLSEMHNPTLIRTLLEQYEEK